MSDFPNGGSAIRVNFPNILQFSNEHFLNSNRSFMLSPEKSNVQTLPTVMPKTQSECNSKIPETNFLRTGRPAGWSAGVSECLASGGCARECHQWLKHSPPSWYKLTVVLPSRSFSPSDNNLGKEIPRPRHLALKNRF